MKKLLFPIVMSILLCVSAFAQERPVHSIMLEPIRNDDMKYETDLCSIDFSYYDFDGSLLVTVKNKTDKRAYIEWENARLDNNRVVFGDDSRLSMRNTKADESIPANSSSISRDIMSEDWIGSDYIDSPISPKNMKGIGLAELSVVIPIRFEEGETIDYRFKLSIYTYNPVDCSQISEGMKAKEVRSLLGKPDSMKVDPMGTANTKAIWYYSGNAIIDIKKGVVASIINLKRPYMEE